MTTISIHDQATFERDVEVLRLEFSAESITVRDLIRRRIQAEVDRFNSAGEQVFRGLVQPTEAKQTLNGYRVRKGRRIDWEEQFEQALVAFESNGFLLLVELN